MSYVDLRLGCHNFAPAVFYFGSMKMYLRPPALAAALAMSCFLAPFAMAQDRLSRTELTAVTNELETSVEELQTRNEQLQVQNADIALKMRDLEAENSKLNGRIETLQFQLGQSRDEVSRMQSDDQEIGRQLGQYENLIEALTAQVANLDARLTQREQVYRISDAQVQANASEPSSVTPQAAETRTLVGISEAAAAAPALAATEASNLPSGADPLFQDGKARLLRFDYEGAERSFQAFLERYPTNSQAGEAQYWLGEVLYQQKSYSESGAAYSDMIRNFPTDSRAPDALVKRGRSLRLMGDTDRACAVLETLPTRYPDASPVTRNLADVERSRSSCNT